MNVDLEHAIHNNTHRLITTNNYLNKIVLYKFRKSFEFPTKQEGFTQIVLITLPYLEDDIYEMYLH